MNSAFRSSMRCGAPVLGLCGFSGSGKTTLLEAAIPRLIERGLAVAVVKHDAHGFVVDKQGKDSDRLFRAGASVMLRGPEEQFQRRHASAMLPLSATLADFGRDHDLLLVEGHKATSVAKLWLEDADRTPPPDGVTHVIASLAWDGDRVRTFLDYVDAWLPTAWSERPLYCGVLIGGQSSRMGSPKQLVNVGGRQMGEIVAAALSYSPRRAKPVALGSGALPRCLESHPQLADAPGFAGPCAGVMAAHRWAPEAAWIVAACDHPWLTSSAVAWLASFRQPGIWAVMPRQPDGLPCPTLALYEPQALEVLERVASDSTRLAVLVEHPRTLIVTPPLEHQRAWENVNTPEELRSCRELNNNGLGFTPPVSGERETCGRPQDKPDCLL